MEQTQITTSTELGKFIAAARKKQGVTQDDVALASGTGRRFIIDLENGKQTAHLQKTLDVLNVLGLTVTVGATNG